MLVICILGNKETMMQQTTRKPRQFPLRRPARRTTLMDLQKQRAANDGGMLPPTLQQNLSEAENALGVALLATLAGSDILVRDVEVKKGFNQKLALAASLLSTIEQSQRLLVMLKEELKLK